MWYVNTEAEKQAQLQQLRFIRTMWYVNKIDEEERAGEKGGFIRTMWYVNSNKAKNGIEPIEFYKNYVVCKLNRFFNSIKIQIGFIRTMWYVNLVNLSVLPLALFVL